MNQIKEITFVFLLFNTSGNTADQEQFNGKIETQLLNSTYFPHINIVIVYTNFFNIPDSAGIDTFGTRLIELTKNKNSDVNWEMNTVANFGNINIGSQDTLGLIFTYIKANYIANKYIVYSNNHSNQFGALNDTITWNSRKNLNTLNTKIEFFGTEDTTRRPFSYFTYDIESKPKIDMLTYNEFSKAFINGFIKNLRTENKEVEKVSLLILVSCYSATIDNVINFSDSVKYLCVAESEISYNFINVAKFIEFLAQPNGNSLEIKLEEIFNRITKDYPDQDNVETNKIALTEFNCYNLSHQETLNEIVADLNKLIVFSISHPQILKKIRESGYRISNDIAYIYRDPPEEGKPSVSSKRSIDFFSFLTNIETSSNDAYFTTLIESLKKNLKSILSFRFNPESKRLGLSCFFPNQDMSDLGLDEKQLEYMAATYSPYSSQSTKFSKETLWPELLQAIAKIKLYESL